MYYSTALIMDIIWYNIKMLLTNLVPESCILEFGIGPQKKYDNQLYLYQEWLN